MSLILTLDLPTMPDDVDSDSGVVPNPGLGGQSSRLRVQTQLHFLDLELSSCLLGTDPVIAIVTVPVLVLVLVIVLVLVFPLVVV